MAEFNSSVEYVLKNEGDLVDHPHDKGGITNRGISFNFLKSISHQKMAFYGLAYTNGEELRKLIKDMSLETAKKVYKGEFWDDYFFKNIHYQSICNYFFDMSVSHGIQQATKIVQRALWACNVNRANLIDDGIFGLNTLATINAYEEYLLFTMHAERAGFYRLIVAKDSSQEVFLNGWLNRCYK